MIRPAYLAPDLKASILDGRQPSGLTLEAITKTEMPLDWNDQRQLYANGPSPSKMPASALY